MWDVVSLVVSAVIGSAIFLIPATLLRPQPSPLAAMLAMVFAGLLSWFGALAYAEMGAMFPDTGGEYVYLRESWGRLSAFLLGWSFFAVIQGGGLAALAVGFSTLLGGVVPLTPWTAKAVAVSLLMGLTFVNVLGVRQGAWFGHVMNAIKLSGLLWMIVTIATRPAAAALDWSWPRNWTLLQFSAALVPALWAYEGWNMAPCVAGEMVDARRTLPRALGIGLGVVMAVYCVSLWVTMRALPVPQILATTAAGTSAVQTVLGGGAALWVTLTILFALVGCTNSCILGAARVYYAQARDGLFFEPFGRVHPRFRTPAFSLIAHGVWSSLLVFTGTYETLISYCTFGAWIFYALVVAGVMLLRRRNPSTTRPYRVWGYPWTPMIFIAVAAAFILSCFITTPGSSFAGLALILSGIPLYLYWRRRVTPGRA
ncbi:APC family permease [Paludibaculum fermentans]|uniref:APC family permease n=1 Tax=Paludibaculum fermentans TaxID=1473598 RepID=UPI003EB85C1B